MSLVVGTNSWVTLVEANAYMNDKWDASDWSGLTDLQKESLLISAYRRIRSVFSIAASNTDENVKYAQIELAWYIYEYWDDHERRAALYAQGVREFKISRFSETLVGTQLPQHVLDLLDDYNTKNAYFAELDRELD